MSNGRSCCLWPPCCTCAATALLRNCSRTDGRRHVPNCPFHRAANHGWPRHGSDGRDRPNCGAGGYPFERRAIGPRHDRPQRARLRRAAGRQGLSGRSPGDCRGRGPGRAIMAEFEGGIGKPCYEVKLLSDDGKLTHHRVDANSGQVTKSDDHPIESYFTSLKPSNLRDVDLSLRQAAVIAAKTGDKVAEAQIEREDDGVQYKITVVTNGEGHEVKVGADGRIIPSR
ncbi:PepSY domain-containing protein [Methylobacterium tardum]|uniref:PepSY domain-containing protein n=2 Tax=Methylobacterium tardum TaxID=374432 RepID=UPI003614C39B